MMLAAPAMPNARASELPMMIIISAPDTQSSICACSIDRLPCAIARPTGLCTAVTRMPMSAAATSLPNSMNGWNLSAMTGRRRRAGDAVT